MQSSSNYLNSMPQSWVLQPKFSTRSDLLRDRKKEYLIQCKDISPTNQKFFEILKKDKEKIRNYQGLSPISSDLDKKDVRYQYIKSPEVVSFSELMQHRKKIRGKPKINENNEELVASNEEENIKDKINEKISCEGFSIKNLNKKIDVDDILKIDHRKLRPFKAINLPAIQESFENNILTSQTPSPKKLNISLNYKRNSRNLDLSLKPNEILHESYENHSKFGIKSKYSSSFLRKVENFALDLPNEMPSKEKISRSNQTISLSISQRLQSMNREKHGPKIMISSGFKKNFS